MLPLQCHHPHTSLLCYQPPFTSFSMFINNFQPSLSHFSPFAPGQFVCHSLSALLQKLICNLFVLDQKFVLDQVVSQISSVLFSKCSAPLLCFVLHVCVCLWLFPYCVSLAGASMEQTMLTHPGHLLMTWLKLPSSQLGGGFWTLEKTSLDSGG